MQQLFIGQPCMASGAVLHLEAANLQHYIKILPLCGSLVNHSNIKRATYHSVHEIYEYDDLTDCEIVVIT